MWLRNAWYVAGWRHELAPGQLLARAVIGEPLVFYRTGDGRVVAMEDRCCHRLAPLSKGRLEQDDLRCMYHGLKFAPDGRCIEIPGQAVIPPNAAVRTYAAAESGGWIWVWMGAAADADPAQIPPSVAADDPAWRLRTGRLDYAADYQLINDNLLDLSHLSFAHANTLGRGAPQWAAERPQVTRLPRGFRFQRWIRDQAAPRFLAERRGERFDLWHAYDYLVPGIFLQRTAWYPAGSAERPGIAPEAPPIVNRLDEQAVTPATARSARYFYAVGARRQDIDDAMAERMLAFTETAFHEDKGIIEAQQQVIELAPDRRMMSTSLDAGPTQFRRLMAELIAREGTPAHQADAAPRRA